MSDKATKEENTTNTEESQCCLQLKIGENSQEADGSSKDYTLESAKNHTDKADKLGKCNLITLIILMILGIVYYTQRYLDNESNKNINTETKKVEELELPVIVIKDGDCDSSSSGCWKPEKLSWPKNNSYPLLDCLKQIPTRANISDEKVSCYRWTADRHNIVIIPPKNAKLEIGNEEYLTLELYFSIRRITDEDEESDFQYMLYRQFDYVGWMWVYDRDTFIKNLDSHINDSGLNAPLMINPSYYYNTLLSLEIKKNFIKNKKRKIYDLSMNGMSGDKDLINYGSKSSSDNKTTIYYDTVIYLNTPINGEVIKDVISHKYDVYDIISSVGGLYSIIALIFGLSFGWIVWGIGIEWFERILNRFPCRCLGLCRYAEPDDHILHTQIENVVKKLNNEN